ncbi:MAG: 50S ribosomal protein L25 [Oligoflexia bacterium]|nr:50S ribosomal protein L25 [Oligoflexia bacterium]
MKTIEIEVQQRDLTGKGSNRRLRNQGLIPAILYGSSKKNFNIQTSTKTITLLVNSHNENAIITLKSSAKDVNGKHVLLKDWDRDILTRGPLHVDFYEIDLKKSVRVRVPLHFTGKAKGITDGGIVSPVVREIEVDCLPTAIPEFLEVDVTHLGIGDSVHIEELVVPEGVKKHFVDNYTIVTCSFIKEEVIVVPDPTAVATLAEPEVMAKGKKDEEGEEGAAKPAAGAKAPAAAKGGDKK